MADQPTEFTDISSLRECPCAKVTGVVSQVSKMSPTEKGLTEYFHATLMNRCDETRLLVLGSATETS